MKYLFVLFILAIIILAAFLFRQHDLLKERMNQPNWDPPKEMTNPYVEQDPREVETDRIGEPISPVESEPFTKG